MKPTDVNNPSYFHKVVDCQWACPGAHQRAGVHPAHRAGTLHRRVHAQPRVATSSPASSGRTCDRPCEPACRRTRIDEKPVAICRLKRVAADLRDDVSDLLPGVPAKKNGKRIACIGAGPASLTVANDLAPLGYEVVIFEQLRRARRADAHEHPDLPPAARRCSTKRSAMILDMGVEIRYGTPVDEHEGAARRQAASTPCSSAAARRGARSWSCPGGDEAGDRHPHRHRLAGRRRVRPHRQDRRARADHRRRQHGHGLLPHVAPARRQGRQGHGAPAAPVLQGVAVGARGRRGGAGRDRRQPRAQALRRRGRQAHGHGVRARRVERGRERPADESKVIDTVVIPADDVILAIGQENAFPWIERDIGIEFDEWGMPVVDKVTLQSTRPGVFFGGDAALGPEEHHLGRRARPPGGDLDPQPLPGHAGHRAPAAGDEPRQRRRWGCTSGATATTTTRAKRAKMKHVDLRRALREARRRGRAGLHAEQTAREVERCLNCDIADAFHATRAASSATPASTSAR